MSRVVHVDAHGAAIETGRRTNRVDWHTLRAAAQQDDDELRAAYGAILSDARRLADARGLRAWRVDADGLYRSRLYASERMAAASRAYCEREWRRRVRFDYDLHEGAVVAHVVALDPDQASDAGWDGRDPEMREVVYL